MNTALVWLKQVALSPGTLILFALIGLMFHRSRCGYWVALLSLLLLLCLSLPVVINPWARIWERVPVLSSEQAEMFKPQALVVIGGGLQNNGLEFGLSYTLSTRSLLRVRYAAKLAWDLGLPILVSGGAANVDEYGDVITEAQLMADVLEREFKTPVAWVEQQSQNTAENARFSHSLLADMKVERIVLVTEAYHMPRAEQEFRKAGFDVLPAPTAFIGHEVDTSWIKWIPSSQAQTSSYLLAYEGLAKLWYGLRD